MDEFVARGLEVRKHAHQLKHGIVEILSFIDDHHNPLSLAELFGEQIFEPDLHFDKASLQIAHPETGQQSPQKIQRSGYGLEQKYDASFIAKNTQRFKEQGGLSQPGCGDQRDESASGLNPIDEGVQRLFVRGG